MAITKKKHHIGQKIHNKGKILLNTLSLLILVTVSTKLMPTVDCNGHYFVHDSQTPPPPSPHSTPVSGQGM